jgi:hypothetical protein
MRIGNFPGNAAKTNVPFAVLDRQVPSARYDRAVRAGFFSSAEVPMRVLQWLCVWTLLMVWAGCQPESGKAILVRGMNVNGYEFDYELTSPSSIQADSRDVQIRSGKILIEVVEGKLRVDGRSYGAVKQKDRIAVEGDRVSVNGEVRPQGD